MIDRPCMLNPEKWRVSGRLVETAVNTVTLSGGRNFYAWGIWPPGWDLDGAPLLWYPFHHQAFRAAFDRAQFAASPPPNVKQHATFPFSRQEQHVQAP